jgi:hypothetical protein
MATTQFEPKECSSRPARLPIVYSLRQGMTFPVAAPVFEQKASESRNPIPRIILTTRISGNPNGFQA